MALPANIFCTPKERNCIGDFFSTKQQIIKKADGRLKHLRRLTIENMLP
jgi:hypothetical protein